MIELLEAFAGYGSQALALKRAGTPFKHAGILEIDKFAVTAHRALHGDVPNFGDITAVDPRALPYFNFFTYSFPCQDISVSGKGLGIQEGTRSGLLWHCERIIRERLPEVLFLENVKNLVSKKHKASFLLWLEFLDTLGYTTNWDIVDAKEHGVPQSRARVFAVSVLGGTGFTFPAKAPLLECLADRCETRVDEKYYLRPEQYSTFLENLSSGVWNTNPSGRGMNGKVHSSPTAPCLTTNKGEGVKVIVTEGHTNLGYESERVIIGTSGISRALRARDFKGPLKILETSIRGAALRGRDAGISGGTVQNLEVGYEYSNCLTSVQKDSLLIEVREPSRIGDTEPRKHQTSGIYNPESPAPTLLATGYKNLAKIMQLGNGAESSNRENPKIGRVYTGEGVSPTLNTCGGGSGEAKILTQDVRVRKLTPLEYFRLMDVSDGDFFKIKEALIREHYGGRDRANSQLYKLAGNSICVGPMAKVFAELQKQMIT